MNMKETIEKSKAEFDAELARKEALAKESNVDVRELFTDEELEVIFSRNDNFRGKTMDFSAVQRYEKVKEAALWMDVNNLDVIGVGLDSISKDKPNAIVTMDIRRLVSLRGKALQVFITMCTLSDTVFVAGTKDTSIRYTFGVENIWNR